MTAGSRTLRAGFRRCLFPVLLLVAAAAPAAAAAEEYAFIPTGASSLTLFDTAGFVPRGTVQLAGTSLWGMTTSPATQRLYAFDINTQTVLVIDAVRHVVIDSIPLHDLRFTPRGMAVSADGKRLYFAAENKSLGLIGIDLERGLRMGEFAVPNAWRVVPHPTLDKLWVSTMYGELYTVRASDMAILGHWQFMGAEIALSDDGSKLYLTGSRGTLLVIDAATDEILHDIAIGFNATTLRVAGRWAYLGHKEKGVLEVVDLLDRHVEAEITLDVGRYLGVHQIDVTADGSRVVVLLDNDLRYKFAVVDGERHTLVSLHDGAGRAPICASRFIMAVHIPVLFLTVNSAADAVDATPGDGVCETGAGNGTCTLRAAVQEGNAAPGTTIVEVPAGEYLLSIPGMDEDQGATGDLDVLGKLTIRGAGSEATFVDGGALDRLMQVGGGGSLRLEGLTVRNGRLPFRDPDFFTNRGGAGILNEGVLTLAGVAVLANSVDGFGGAGVHSDGVLHAEDCTFSANVSKGNVLSRGVWRELEGVAAIYARQAEVTRCQVTANTGAVAVSMDGPLSAAVVSDNDARGVKAGSISNSSVRGNRGPGCTASLIVDSTVSDNVNGEPDGCGGGVFWGDRYRQLVIARSTISGNSAVHGGGICAQFFEMGNSTVSGNAATGDGGGIHLLEYDVWNSIRNSTITANTADSDNDGFGDGGGVFNQSQGTYFDTHLENTILAGNVDLGGEAPDCSGHLGSSQFNLVGDLSGCGFAPLGWDITGSAAAPVEPGLGPLQDNGGPTPTHALLAGSPAIDAGHPYVFLPTDQRGVSRPQDGDQDGSAYSDIGAFELSTSSRTITASAGAGGSITPAGPVSVPSGGSVNFDITPLAHHHVADVLVDGVSVGPVSSWAFDDVVADHTIAASFAIDSYTIRTSSGAGGSIAPLGAVRVPHGGSLTVRLRPRAGYQVAKLIVDGRTLVPRTRFTIRGCSANHVIQARFRRIY